MIELANPDDYGAIAALNVAAFREFADRMTPEGWSAMQARVSDVATRAQVARFFVVREGNAVVASIGYWLAGQNHQDDFPSEWAAVLLLAVAPAHRGRGLARELVAACIECGRKAAAPAIGLYTSELMTAAQHLYESMGFRRDGELPNRHGLRYWRYKLDLRSRTAPYKAPIP